MHMPMKHHRGPIFPQQPLKALKPPVRQIRLIPQPRDRRMGQQNIKPAGLLQLPLSLAMRVSISGSEYMQGAPGL